MLTDYRDFQSKLIPTADPETFIGVRTPELRKLAKQLIKRDDIRSFLEDLPHHTFDENQLHAFLLSERKDYETCIKEVEQFLPFVDNWATCDQMSPKVFRKIRCLQRFFESIGRSCWNISVAGCSPIKPILSGLVSEC